MKYDYSKLLGRIIEKFGSQSKFADAIDLSMRSLSLKMNQRIDWRQKEIQLAISVLGLSVQDIPTYFFTLKVQ